MSTARLFRPPPYHHYHPGYVVERLPSGYRTALLAGLTYFVLNDIWYRNYGQNQYVVVDAPATTNVVTTTTTTTTGSLTPVDINGIRYYVKDGRFYRRDANGQFLEVTPPSN